MACSAVCIVAAFLHTDDARGQKRFKVQPVDAQGTVLSVTPHGVIAIRTATGDYLADTANQEVSLGPAQVEIRGMVPPKFLKKGMFVRFEAELEFKRRVKGQVSELKLVALNKQPVRTVRPGNGGQLRPAGVPGAVPRGAAPNPLSQSGFIRLDTPPEGEEKGIRGKPVTPKLAKYAVVGQVISTVRGNTFSVAVKDGRTVKKLRVNLADDAKIELFLTDIRFVRPGDKIIAKGTMRIGANQRRFWATQITITRGELANNLGAAQPVKPGERREFGDVGRGVEEKEKVGAEFEGVILKIN